MYYLLLLPVLITCSWAIADKGVPPGCEGWPKIDYELVAGGDRIDKDGFGAWMKRAKDGDPDARDSIVKALNQHLPRVLQYWLDRRHQRVGEHEFNDLIQQMILGIVSAGYNYDPAKSALSTWFKVIVSNLLSRHNARVAKQGLVGLHGGMGEDSERPDAELVPDTRAPTHKDANEVQVQSVLRLLTTRERAIVSKRLGLTDIKMEALAEQLGITKQRISQIEGNSLAQMKDRYALLEGGDGEELGHALERLPPKERDALILMAIEKRESLSARKELNVSADELMALQQQGLSRISEYGATLPVPRQKALLRDLARLDSSQSRFIDALLQEFIDTGSFPDSSQFNDALGEGKLFLSDSHAKVAFVMGVQKRLAELNSTSPSRHELDQKKQLTLFDPFESFESVPSRTDPFAALHEELFNDYRRAQQHAVAQTILGAALDAGKIPSLTDAAVLAKMSVAQLVGTGSEFGPRGDRHARRTFDSEREFMRFLQNLRESEIKRLQALPNKSESEANRWRALVALNFDGRPGQRVYSTGWQKHLVETRNAFFDPEDGAIATLSTIDRIIGTRTSSTASALLAVAPHLSSNPKIRELIEGTISSHSVREEQLVPGASARRQVQLAFYLLCEAHNDWVKSNPGKREEITLDTLHTAQGAREALFALRRRISELKPQEAEVFASLENGAITAFQFIDGFGSNTVKTFREAFPHLSDNEELWTRVEERMTNKSAGKEALNKTGLSQKSSANQVLDCFYWICEAHNDWVTKNPGEGRYIEVDKISTLEGTGTALFALRGRISEREPNSHLLFMNMETGAIRSLNTIEGFNGTAKEGTTAEAMLAAFPHLAQNETLAKRIRHRLTYGVAGRDMKVDKAESRFEAARQVQDSFYWLCEEHNKRLKQHPEEGQPINLENLNSAEGAAEAMFALRGRISEKWPEKVTLFRNLETGAVAALKEIKGFQGAEKGKGASTADVLIRMIPHLADDPNLSTKIRKRLSNPRAGFRAAVSDIVANEVRDVFYWMCEAHNRWVKQNPKQGVQIDLTRLDEIDMAREAIKALKRE